MKKTGKSKKKMVLAMLLAGCATLASTAAFAAEATPVASSVVPSSAATFGTAICGGTVTAGSPIYLDPADSNKAKAASQSSLTTAAVVGIASTACASGQMIRYVIEDPDFTPGLTLVEGEAYCLGHGATGGTGTAGGIGECRLFSAVTPVAGSGGTYFVHLMTAKSTTKAKLRINVPPSAY